MGGSLLFEESTGVERLAVRQEAFAHQIGLALLPSLSALEKHHVLESLLEGVTVKEFLSRSGAKSGFLAVVLRALSSAGWIKNWHPSMMFDDAQGTVSLILTPRGEKILGLLQEAPQGLAHIDKLLKLAQELPGYLFENKSLSNAKGELNGLVELFLHEWSFPKLSESEEDLDRASLVDYFNGCLAAPLMVHLAKNQVLQTKGQGRKSEVLPWFCWPISFDESHLREVESFVYPVFRHLGWSVAAGKGEQLTQKGKIAVFFASAYVVTLSYVPLFMRMEDLLFGHERFDAIFPLVDGVESHLDRPLNIWGSGAAHEMYFKQVHNALIEIFSRKEHPLAVCDTGCGNGEFLRHIYQILRYALQWNFSEKPIYFIGSDLNKQCREQTAITLKEAGVPNGYVLPENIDINFPGKLAAAIENLHLPVRDPESGRPRRLYAVDALHTNSMLIHNRRYLPPETSSGKWPVSQSDALYADSAGRGIPPQELQENLIEFMRRWKPVVERYGWLFIELHTVCAKTIAQDPHRTPTIAYDLTHGFTSQYPVERHELLAAAEVAGLRLGADKLQATFPSEKLTRVSMTYLRG